MRLTERAVGPEGFYLGSVFNRPLHTPMTFNTPFSRLLKVRKLPVAFETENMTVGRRREMLKVRQLQHDIQLTAVSERIM